MIVSIVIDDNAGVVDCIYYNCSHQITHDTQAKGSSLLVREAVTLSYSSILSLHLTHAVEKSGTREQAVAERVELQRKFKKSQHKLSELFLSVLRFTESFLLNLTIFNNNIYIIINNKR